MSAGVDTRNDEEGVAPTLPEFSQGHVAQAAKPADPRFISAFALLPAFLLGVLLFARQDPAPSTAPPPPPPPSQPETNVSEISTRDSPATFQAKVNLVQVQVVVRDSNGKAIGNLKKENFLLFDQGKRQEVTKFVA
ncbi:MAG: hypothetical protein WBW33_08995, partial [Bryobacteraceae bacterium]